MQWCSGKVLADSVPPNSKQDTTSHRGWRGCPASTDKLPLQPSNADFHPVRDKYPEIRIHSPRVLQIQPQERYLCQEFSATDRFSQPTALNHGTGKSAAMKCAALGAPITEGTRVCRQLQRKQKKHQQDLTRNRSSKYRAKKRTLVKQKFQMYFQRAENETQAGYLKGMSNPLLFPN